MNDKISLKLYIVGDPNLPSEIINSLKKVLDEELKDGYEIKAVNVLNHPEEAMKDGVLATPTLVRIRPEPVLRVLGDLSDCERVMRSLQIDRR